MFRLVNSFVFWRWASYCLAAWSIATPLRADGVSVNAMTIERQSFYDVQRLFAGRVVGSQRADIAFEQSGRVVRLHVDDGQRVKRGEVLAELDTDALNIERREWRAAQREVGARLEQLQRDQARFEALSEKGYVSQGQLDELDSRIQATSQQLAQAEQRLHGVALRLQKSQLVAPFDGEIASLSIEEGVVVSAGRAVLQLVVTGRNEAVFGVSDQLGRDLLPGDEMQIARGDQRWPVTVVAVSKNLDWRTQTRTVRVALPASAPFVDGETVHLLLNEQRDASGFWLPMTAMVGDVRGTWAIYQLDADDAEGYRLRKRSVQPLHQFRGQVFVEGELQTGDWVVVNGTHRLTPGERVRISAPQRELANAE